MNKRWTQNSQRYTTACKGAGKSSPWRSRFPKNQKGWDQQWLVKQALWQVFLPAPRYIPRPKFDVSSPNAVHQADLFLPHDELPRECKSFQIRPDRCRRCQPPVCRGCEILSENLLVRAPEMASTVASKSLERVHGRCFQRNGKPQISYSAAGRVDIHRDQAIVEWFNRTLAERLFGHQYAFEMRLPSGQLSTG